MCNSLSTPSGAGGWLAGASAAPAKLHSAHARASMNLYVIYPWTTIAPAAPAPSDGYRAAKLMAKLLGTRTRSRSGTRWFGKRPSIYVRKHASCGCGCACVCAPNICEIITFEIMRLNVPDSVRKFGAKIARLPVRCCRWQFQSRDGREHAPFARRATTAATKGVMTRVIDVHMHHCQRPLSRTARPPCCVVQHIFTPPNHPLIVIHSATDAHRAHEIKYSIKNFSNKQTN